MKTFFWGLSIALAWTWGIGLFFSIQTAIQFGVKGLIAFATINAFGLSLFGIVNHFLAKKYGSPEQFEESFLARAKKFKFAFLFYQFLAITLTLFAVLKYVTFPLEILSVLVCVMFVGATIFLGEEFKIDRIKYSHAGMAFLIAVALYVLLKANIFDNDGYLVTAITESVPNVKLDDSSYVIYFLPIVVGFLLGPWLDLQHWQRAIYINKEKLSVATSYIIGGIIFWSILVAHGLLAIAVFNKSHFFRSSIGLFDHVKEVVTRYFYFNVDDQSFLGYYIVFICLAALTTFDSGYVAMKWYLKSLVKDSKNILLSIVPQSFVTSPIPWFVFFAISAVTTLHFTQIGEFIGRFDPKLVRFFQFELEYYMAFFASFLVMFAVTFIRSMLHADRKTEFEFLKLLSVGLCSLAIFGIGYFGHNVLIMAFASILPVIYGIVTHDQGQKLPSEINSEKIISEPVLARASSETSAQLMPLSNYSLPDGAVPSSVQGCYIKEKWFVHTFIPTYQDTNSVGNVYFAMYAMWVGKTRELFFLHTMPDFDLNTTDFYILTRSFEHKFVRETREFDPVSVHIRIKEHNRKFVVLEHKVFNSQNELLGKGSQSLMFVNSKDYSLIDVPQQMYPAHAQFV